MISNTELKQVVYAYKCNQSTLQVKGKINSITIGKNSAGPRRRVRTRTRTFVELSDWFLPEPLEHESRTLNRDDLRPLLGVC